ncbi:PREDICTED: protein PET117 homolog, mitochondrial [Leptosomus discolor]|uniref:protein PET117 homolog, mitochondrial n=1 Tax=Leptosomus discolor TaxID=188344 RepID=UPI000522A45A|nr:PREDICTED: protein PET117 homolog, mitochondrial [Leptosomus discolor]
MALHLPELTYMLAVAWFAKITLNGFGCYTQGRCCKPLPGEILHFPDETMRLHSGVLRDLERQSQKKENIRLLEEQIALTKQLMEERDKALMEKGSQQS